MQTDNLTAILYSILTNEALTIPHRRDLIRDLLENLNYLITLDNKSSIRVRMKAVYNDSNGLADFTTKMTIDSNDKGDQVPRITTYNRIGKTS